MARFLYPEAFVKHGPWWPCSLETAALWSVPLDKYDEGWEPTPAGRAAWERRKARA